MTDEQWQAAWKLYQTGRSFSPEQARSFLGAATSDPEVRETVLAMLIPSSTELGPDRIGQRIGRYVLTERLGEGGMGEVYAARDSELGRPVAIKFVSAQPTGTASPVEGFIREAKAISALNHPNIVTIHEVIHASSKLAIVMELVDGIPLRRLCGAPAPVDRVLHLGGQAARALAAAHARGIVHCDIKPENLMVRPDGLVKVLDFGLARDLARTSSHSIWAAGTLSYMSPEQSRGETPSGASDVFSLGIVLYELAAGAHPFESVSILETLNALNEAEPPAPSTRNAFLPAQADSLILAMLAKDRSLRPSAAKVALVLESGFQGGPLEMPTHAAGKKKPARSMPARRRAFKIRRPGWLGAAAIGALGIVALGLLYTRAPSRQPRPLIRFSVDLGREAILSKHLTAAVSPDGTRLAYLVREGAGPNLLATRLLNQPKPSVFAGTENATDPFFSPDGQWIGFFTPQSLKKVSVNAGAPETLCPVDGAARGGTWGKDGYIIANLDNSHLVRVPEGGGKPEMLSSRPEQHGQQTWRWPQFLPTGKTVLFTGSRGSGVGAGFEDADIETLSLGTGRVQVLHSGGYFGRYVPSGHLVYIHQGTLFAIPFDPENLKTRGAPTPILDDVAGAVDRAAGQFDFSMAADSHGIFVYRSGLSGEGQRELELAWMDPSGKTENLLNGLAPPITPRVSPDGTQVAFSMEGNILLYDLRRGITIPLTRNGLLNTCPVWMPDGKHIIFSQQGGGESAIWWIRADGSGQPQKLFAAPEGMRVSSITPDGRRVALVRQDATTGWDIWTLSLEPADPDRPKAGDPELFLREPGDQDYPAFSPDGQWIAYSSSSENDVTETFVRPYPAGPSDRKWQVSTNRGRFPVWSRDGKLLLFLAKDSRVMAVSCAVKGSIFASGTPRVWSPAPVSNTGVHWTFDLAADGKHIVASPRTIRSAEDQGSVHVTVLLNFFDELNRRVP
jgi:serine/threonine-protein kinase